MLRGRGADVLRTDRGGEVKRLSPSVHLGQDGSGAVKPWREKLVREPGGSSSNSNFSSLFRDLLHQDFLSVASAFPYHCVIFFFFFVCISFQN